MTSFGLVHGAWHGSWCWKRVRRSLQARGHEVFTPTLTGVGERSHLLSRDVSLETHILDVVNLIECEELSGIVLCGHSYGGCVISGVADRIPDRIRSLVYLDAFVLEDGENLLQHVPEEQRIQLIEGANQSGDGWKVPPIPAALRRVRILLQSRSRGSATRRTVQRTRAWQPIWRASITRTRRCLRGSDM